MNKEKKQYYKVEVEGWVKTVIKYKVLAETPEKALELISKYPQLLEAPKQNLATIKKIRAKVYILGSSILQFIKNF